MNKRFEASMLSLAGVLIVLAAAGFYYNHFIFGRSKPLTLGEAAGSVLQRQNEVKRIPENSFVWDRLDSEDPVFYRDTVYVGPGSSLNLDLNGETELHVGENSLIKLVQKTTMKDGVSQQVIEIDLVRGDVAVTESKRGSKGPPKKVRLNLGKNAQVDLSRDTQMAVSKRQGTARILVEKGDVKLTSESAKGPESKTLHEVGQKPTLTENIAVQSADNTLKSGATKLAEASPEATTSEDLLQKIKKDAPAPPTIAEAVQIPPPQAPPKSAPKAPRSRKVAKEEALPPEPKEKPEKPGKPQVVLVSPEKGAVVDWSELLSSVAHSWEFRSMDPTRVLFQLSASPRFSPLLREWPMDTVDAFSWDPATDPELMKRLQQHSKLYWRVVPLGEKGTSLIRPDRLPARVLNFNFSRSAQLKVVPRILYNKSLFLTEEHESFQMYWTLKRALPGSYQIQFASDMNFKNTICAAELYKLSDPPTGKSKPDIPEEASVESDVVEDELFNTATSTPRTVARKVAGRGSSVNRRIASDRTIQSDLIFDENMLIEPNVECPLEETLTKQDVVYYRVTAKDWLGRNIALEDPGQSVGEIYIRDWTFEGQAAGSFFHLYYRGADSSTLNSNIQVSATARISAYFRQALEIFAEVDYALLRYLFQSGEAEFKQFVRFRAGTGYHTRLWKSGDRHLKIGARVGGEVFTHLLGDYDYIVGGHTTFMGLVLGVPLEYQIFREFKVRFRYAFFLGLSPSSTGHDYELSFHYQVWDNWNVSLHGRLYELLTSDGSAYTNSVGMLGLAYDF